MPGLRCLCSATDAIFELPSGNSLLNLGHGRLDYGGMRYIVGYGPEHHGLDAINLAATLARTSGAKVDVVVVLPDDSPTFHMYSPDRAFNEELEAQAEEWLAEGQSHVPSDVSVTGRIQRAESIVEGLIAEAEDAERSSGDDLIVVGTSHRVRLGSIADALLHSSAVPVALAPIGIRATTRGHAHHLCNRRPGGR